jgi:hypothetical protein
VGAGGLRKVRSATPWHLRFKTKTIEMVRV